MAKLGIDRVDVKGRRVLMRVDFNVPIEDGKITDDRRIVSALPSIESVLRRGGRLILMSHLGRPEGGGYEGEYTLRPCAERLAQLLGDVSRNGVVFPSQDCIDQAAAAAVNRLADGECLMLENLRFHKAEKKGDEAFARKLAAYGDVYCNNAFGTCHRPDASMVAVPKAMTGKPRVCGTLVAREIQYLSDALTDPRRPFVVILGGAKVSDKLPTIDHLITRANTILIGGAMAYTFLKAQGASIGASRCEQDKLADAARMIALAAAQGCNLMLPTDHLCSTAFSENEGQHKTFACDIADGFMGLDIGPDTIGRYSRSILEAGTIVWNGPMGVFEWPIFATGTRQLAEAVARATRERGAISIVGGGDSAAAAEKFGVADQLSHVSTGGGASLEMLSGAEFESVNLLDDA